MLKTLDSTQMMANVRKDTPGSQVKVHFNNAGKTPSLHTCPALAKPDDEAGVVCVLDSRGGGPQQGCRLDTVKAEEQINLLT